MYEIHESFLRIGQAVDSLENESLKKFYKDVHSVQDQEEDWNQESAKDGRNEAALEPKNGS